MTYRQATRAGASLSGFSLLEVLVALVIFAIGVSGMLVTLTHHMRDISFTQEHARAVRIATREMNRLRRTRFVPEEESTGDEGRYSWQVVVEEVDEELPGMTDGEAGKSQGLKPYEMSLVVQWSDAPGGEPNSKVELHGLELFQKR